jgi:hypothetical protein
MERGCLSLVSVVCCQVEVSSYQADHSSRGVLSCVVWQRRRLHKATLCAVHQLVSKLAMPVTCRNEKAEQSARSTSVYHPTSEMN